MSPLAKKVLELDRKYPGDASAPMELPATLWAELVALARAEAGRQPLGDRVKTGGPS